MIKKDVYICNTYYHLLISIIKTILKKEKAKNDLIIFTDRTNKRLSQDKGLIDRIKASELFNKIIIFDHSEEEMKIIDSNKNMFIKKRILLRKISKQKEVDFKIYSNIYIFFDISLLGSLINYEHHKYNLIEDGTDCFKNSNKSKLRQKLTLKKAIKYILNIREMGQSKYIKTIEVNDSKDIMIRNKKIVEMPKKMMLKALTDSEKKVIFDLFIPDFDYKKYNNKNLLITQPLYQDGYFENIEDQINMYKKIIKEQGISESDLVIKTHTRENIDYKTFFHDAIILDLIFPLEILNFCNNLTFKKIITVSSTSVNSFEKKGKIVILGWNWLKEYKKKNNIV